VAENDQLNEAVVALAAAMTSGDGYLPRAAHVLVRRSCLAEVRRAWPRALDAEDIADEAIARFLARVAGGAVDPAGSPAGYLLVIARNLAARHASESARLESDALSELPAPSPVPQVEDREQLRTAIDRLRRRGDHRAIRVLASWLDLADAGEVPTARKVGDYADMSAMSVLRALRRTNEVLADDGDGRSR
jgi:DNA-directed RNA polymerase specialized sigma24 family protein